MDRKLRITPSKGRLLFSRDDGMEGPGVVVADVWSIHEDLLKHKTYEDMTGNHVNHPNDFIVRIYAQTILVTLGGE